MNREVLYRLWDNENNCYYEEGRRGKGHGWYWFNVTSNGNIITGCDDVIDEPAHVDNWVLEQYTGLRDSKRTPEYPEGQRVFEGSLIKYRGLVFIIEWDDDWSGFLFRCPEWKKNQHSWHFDCDTACQCEVIGNIHQNPELIGDKP